MECCWSLEEGVAGGEDKSAEGEDRSDFTYDRIPRRVDMSVDFLGERIPLGECTSLGDGIPLGEVGFPICMGASTALGEVEASGCRLGESAALGDVDTSDCLGENAPRE